MKIKIKHIIKIINYHAKFLLRLYMYRESGAALK
jgi:hypothetical protein